MPKFRSHYVITIITLLLVVGTTMYLYKGKDRPQQPAATATQEASGLRLIIPDAKWEPFFFKSLDEQIKKVSLPSLRTIVLPEDDLEVRFWYDAFPDTIVGIVLRRSGDQWTGIHLNGTYNREQFRIEQKPLTTPKSGWKAAWERLVKTDILTLPDASEVQCHSGVLDGVGYVVEINVNKTYRTYRYSNPQFAECNEAKRVILIEEIIADEFKL